MKIQVFLGFPVDLWSPVEPCGDADHALRFPRNACLVPAASKRGSSISHDALLNLFARAFCHCSLAHV